MHNRMIKNLDSADLFLRNRANAAPAPLNEYDIEAMLDIANVCNDAARDLERAVVLPCDVGDKLYKPWQAGGRNVVVTYKVIAIQSSKKGEWIVIYKGSDSVFGHRDNIKEIGKSLFLSKEEAKQAMEGGAE